MLSLPLTEASAKMRTGAPVDDKADYTLPIWAGELTVIAPVPDPRLSPGIELPMCKITPVATLQSFINEHQT